MSRGGSISGAAVVVAGVEVVVGVAEREFLISARHPQLKPLTVADEFDCDQAAGGSGQVDMSA